MKFNPVLCSGLIFLSGASMAIETPDYQILQKLGETVEVREYPEVTVATTVVEGDIQRSGNTGFRRLAKYIFGENQAGEKIAMTAPVMQQKTSEVEYEVVFFLPRALSTPPPPKNKDVSIGTITMKAAVLRYRGGWKVSRYKKHLSRLYELLDDSNDWEIVGEPIWARYDPPWMPSFLRTNEVMLPVALRRP